MSRLEALLDRRRFDAALTWGTAPLLLGAGVGFLDRGVLDWGAFAVLLAAVVLLPPLLSRDPSLALPAELVVVVVVPVLARAAGAFPQTSPFLAVAGLALLSAIVAEAYTSLAMTPRFAVVFTVVTTMAFAGAWSVGAWSADAVLGTDLVGDRVELMWDLVAASATGIGAGAVFEAYFQHTDRLGHLRGDESERSPHSPEVVPQERTSSQHILAVRAMQTLLGSIAAVATVRGDWILLVNSVGPLVITFLPAILRREYGYPMDARLVLWVTVAATLHAVGSLGPYRTVPRYDDVAHAVSGALVAGVGYAVARAAELHTDDVSFDPAFRGAFVLLFVLAVGVLWEVLEFASGQAAALTGGAALVTQYGTSDVVWDLIADVVGGGAVAAWSGDYLDRFARALAGRIGAVVGRR